MTINKKNKTALSFILPALTITVMIFYFPMFWGILVSFQNINLNNFSKYLQSPFAGFGNFIKIFKSSDSIYFKSIKNILFYVAITIPIGFIFSFFFAIILNRNFKTKNFFRLIILLPYITPDAVIYTMWRYMFTTYSGIVNQILLSLEIIDTPVLWLIGDFQMWPVIIASIWKIVSFGTLMLLTGLENIPDYVYEASLLDGANALQRFKFITIPLMKPIISTLLLVNIIWHFYAFNQFYVLLGSAGAGRIYDNATVPTIFIRDTAFFQYNHGIAAAMSTLLLIVVLFFTSIYFKIQKKEELLF